MFVPLPDINPGWKSDETFLLGLGNFLGRCYLRKLVGLGKTVGKITPYGMGNSQTHPQGATPKKIPNIPHSSGWQHLQKCLTRPKINEGFKTSSAVSPVSELLGGLDGGCAQVNPQFFCRKPFWNEQVLYAPGKKYLITICYPMKSGMISKNETDKGCWFIRGYHMLPLSW